MTTLQSWPSITIRIFWQLCLISSITKAITSRAFQACGDALAEATTSPYNAVLLDVGLPGGEGFSVLDILRQLNPSLPVIILTVFTSPEYRAGSLSHGAFSWVNKPLRSGGASGSSPPGCSSSCIHRIDSLHHVNNSLTTLLSSFNRALFADGLLSTSINDRLTGG